MITDNLTWAEEESGLWKGWTYSLENNRYYFDDVGNESLAAFWADEFLNQAYKQNGKVMIKTKEWRVSNKVWLGVGFSPAELDQGLALIDLTPILIFFGFGYHLNIKLSYVYE